MIRLIKTSNSQLCDKNARQTTVLAVLRNGNVVGHINKDSLRRARLVLRLVIVRRYTVSERNQTFGPVLPSTVSRMKLSTGQSAMMLRG